MTDRKNLPWLIAGCGPSLRKPHDPEGFNICTLNRALCFFERVDLAFIYHSRTFAAVEGSLGAARKIIFPAPFDTYSDWCAGWFHEQASDHPLFKTIPPRRREVLCRGVNDNFEREFITRSKCLARGNAAVAALAYLVRLYHIDTIYTTGIDGGDGVSVHLLQEYTNRQYHPSRLYDKWFHAFRGACDKLRVKWEKI